MYKAFYQSQNHHHKGVCGQGIQNIQYNNTVSNVNDFSLKSQEENRKISAKHLLWFVESLCHSVVKES